MKEQAMIRLSKKAALFLLGVTRRRSSFPWQLQVELSNKCNLECKMCMRQAMGVPVIDMSKEVFEALVKNLKGVKEVVFRGWGEPLLHDKFLEFAHRFRDQAPQVDLFITTNGHLLKGNMAGEIINMGIGKVSVSIDQTNEKTKGAGHPGSNKVMANIAEFIKLRGSAPYPQLVLQPTMHSGKIKEILDVVSFAKEVGADMVNLLRMDSWVLEGIKRASPKEEKQMIHQAKKVAGKKLKIFFLNQKSLPVQIASRNNRLCLRTLFQPYIDVEGNVTPCCMLRDKIMGNILETSLETIWRNQSFEEFFHQQEKICSRCDAFFSIYHE